jgi:hypothetical protein
MIRAAMTGSLLRAGLLTGVIDALFATGLGRFVYRSSAVRVWQGVAAVPLGRAAFDGGLTSAAAGLLLHFCVAFTWSAVFLLTVERAAGVRRAIATAGGAAAVACVYGPLIWIVMSWVIIPAFTGRAPSLGLRWWVQLAGHVPFVAVPIVFSVRADAARARAAARAA